MTAQDTPSKVAGRLLAWYAEMGVDAAVQSSPVNWLSRADNPPGADFSIPGRKNADVAARAQPAARPMVSSPPAPAARAPRQFPGRAPAAGDGAVPTEAIKKAATLAELKGLLDRFEGCGLKATAKNLCFYRGAEHAPLMIIGEAPGRDEDLAGKPFVGRAGMLLDKMLAAIGLNETSVHITNIVYWRPPGNRTPTPQEALSCRAFLERQAELVAPKVVLALGGAAAKQLFDVTDGIMRLRGKWREIELGGQTFRAMATLHPAYLLRTPAAKGNAWRDLLAVKSALKADP